MSAKMDLLLRQHWQSWGGVLLGAWLFASPWALRYAGLHPAAENAWVIGAVVFTLGIVTRFTFHLVEEFIDFFLGLWMVVSPWALVYTGATLPAANAIIVGALVLLLAILEIRGALRGGPQLA